MALTVSKLEVSPDGGKGREAKFNLAFDNSYPTGGEPLTPADVGLSNITGFDVLGNEGGYSFNYDYSNQKLVVSSGGVSSFTPAGTVSQPTFTGNAGVQPLIVEEIVAVSSNTGTLGSVPAYIMAIDVTAGSTTGSFNVVPTGETPATTECAVTFTNGTLTFAAGDAVTSCRVTYLASREGTFIDNSNFTYDEAITASDSGTNLAVAAAVIQYVYDDTAGALMTPVPVGETPSSGEFALDIDNSGDTTITTNSADNGNSLKVSYLPLSVLPSADMSIGDADLSLTSEAYNWTGAGNIPSLVVPGMGTQFVGEETGAGNENGSWAGPSGTAANGVGVLSPALNTVTTNNTNAIVTLAMPWLVLPDWAFANETSTGTVSQPTFTGNAVAGAAASEVANATDLSSLTQVECVAYGR